MNGSRVLGGLTPADFLARHWQKRPLLVRQALPGFSGFVDRDLLLSLATREDATSRLVIEHPRRKRARWARHDGPFGSLDASMLPDSHWTVLVHGVESLVPGGWELLRAFSFLPAARVDDVMVSYAADGGSVGPHDDRYDVFLVQGPGKRRWRVSGQRELPADPDAAIRVLQGFVPEDEWLLEEGDLLYLPPGVPHHGVAEGPCFTYSIGFLAPTHQELVESFLTYLAGTIGGAIDPTLLYADPDLTPAANPVALGDDMIAKVTAILGAVSWDEGTTLEFLGRFVTRPKPRVRFEVPHRQLSLEALADRLRGRGRVTLALPTRGLVHGRRAFLNGEVHALSARELKLFETLVHERALALPLAPSDRFLALLHGWIAAGYLAVETVGRSVSATSRAR